MDDELYTGYALKQLIQDLVDALDSLVEPDSIFAKPLERARRTLEHWDEGYGNEWRSTIDFQPEIDTNTVNQFSQNLRTEFVEAKTEDGTVYYPAWIDYDICEWYTKTKAGEIVIDPIAWRYHDSREDESNE